VTPKQFALTCFHSLGFLVDGVIPSKEVQNAVYDE
jgi:hypothetical protein